MSLFCIDVSEILAGPVGGTKEFIFRRNVPKDTWEDVLCTDELVISLKLIHEKYGIYCVIEELSTTITLPHDGIEDKSVNLRNIGREFHLKKTGEDTDDIEYVASNDTIDLTRVIEQELLISGL